VVEPSKKLQVARFSYCPEIRALWNQWTGPSGLESWTEILEWPKTAVRSLFLDMAAF